MSKPRRPEFFLISGGLTDHAGGPSLFSLQNAAPSLSTLRAQIVDAAQALASEVDNARLCPDRSPEGRALLRLLDAVHSLQNHETNPAGPASNQLHAPEDPDAS